MFHSFFFSILGYKIAIEIEINCDSMELLSSIRNSSLNLSLKERLNSFEREMNFKRYFDGIKFKEKFLEDFFSKI